MKTLYNKQLSRKSKNQNNMYRLILLFSMLLTFNASANTQKASDVYLESKTENLEECTLSKILFNNNQNLDASNLEVNEIDVVNIEEEVEINFNTKNYLPKGFNALKGKDNLDFNTIEIIEIEEEVELNFDTKQYLPKDFNVLKGKDDVNFNTIEIVEIEEEVTINFDTKIYLPKGFNALKGKDDLDWSKIKLVEIEEDDELNFNIKPISSLQ